MLSEVDIKDWDQIPFKRIKTVMEDAWPVPSVEQQREIKAFFSQVEDLANKQRQEVFRKTAALLRGKHV